ncbi:SpoIIE family protein phosphatase [Streptomyces sp. NPDC127084]|uniref:ATP-binding SpoIIE family protein phosphatase n=1 Tax=Streptomyces sp. NPDC127084 TaxID=3347133 RepID=UPI0036499E19
MRREDVPAVLAAVATGVWRWDNASGTATLDAEAARLLGLPARAGTVPVATLRARFHPGDWEEVYGLVTVAVADGSVAEVRMRILDGEGGVLRTVRSRCKPVIEDGDYLLVGTVAEEVAAVPPGAVAGDAGPAEGTVRDEGAGSGDDSGGAAPRSAPGTPRATGWRRSREAFLLDTGRALAEARSTPEVLRVAASLDMPGFAPDGLVVFGLKGDQLTVIGHHGYDPDTEAVLTDIPLDTAFPAADVIRTGRALYIPTPADYRRRYPIVWPLVEPFGRRSWAFLPLIVAGRTVGVWLASFSQPVAFTSDARSVLTTVARMLAQALSRAGVTDGPRDPVRGPWAATPELGPGIPGMSVAARYVPTGGGTHVGGDWYDLIPLPGGTRAAGGGGGRIALVIGDVQGHDVRAAVLMGQLRIALRAYASEGHRPDAVLARASRFLTGLHEYAEADTYDDGDPVERAGAYGGPRFATCLYIECDPATGTLDIARAGHPDPAIRMADGTVMLRPTEGGLPLGIDPDSDYPTTRVTLEPGETIMVCTDGLLATGGHDLDSGWERVRSVLEAPFSGGQALEKLADALVQAVHGPESHFTRGPLADRREDDIAVLLLSRHGGPPPRRARRTVLTVAQADPARVAVARRQLRELLHDWADGEQVDSAVLMVSEMMTNVLVHTDCDALLVAEATGDCGSRRLRVEVSDSSDELPHRRQPGELASSGRGLVLMEVLADVWGVEPRGEGKSIWFELYEPGPPDGLPGGPWEGPGGPLPGGPSEGPGGAPPGGPSESPDGLPGGPSEGPGGAPPGA